MWLEEGLKDYKVLESFVMVINRKEDVGVVCGFSRVFGGGGRGDGGVR